MEALQNTTDTNAMHSSYIFSLLYYYKFALSTAHITAIFLPQVVTYKQTNTNKMGVSSYY